MTTDLDHRIRKAFDGIIAATGDLGPCPTIDMATVDDAASRLGRRGGRGRWFAAVAAGLLVAVAVGALLIVQRGDEPAVASVDLGPLDRFPAGTITTIDDPPVFVVNDPEVGIRAFDRHSPHLGCILVVDHGDDRYAPTPDEEEGFVDPCHGSRFDRSGNKTAGPAPRGMDTYRFTIVDGRLIVDLTHAIPGIPVPTIPDQADPDDTITGPEPTHTTAPVPTTAAPQAGLSPLVGRTWVRVPSDDAYHYQYELEVEFAEETVIGGHDGCDHWTSQVTITPQSAPDDSSQQFTIGFDPPSTSDWCASGQQRLLTGDVVVRNDRLLVLDDRGGTEAEYLAADTLRPPDPAELHGIWATRSGSRLELLADGSARLGICPPVGRWTYQDATLDIAGFDTAPTETAACAGGTLSGILRSLTPELAEGPVVATVLTDGTNLLLRTEQGAFWLEVSGPVAALDLESSTVYGFGPYADVDADFVVNAVSAVAGEPTLDSGWNTIAPVEIAGEADCYGGLGARFVFWGDVRFGFLRGDWGVSTDRLYAVGVGDARQSALDRYDGPFPPPANEPTLAVQGVGPGSTIDDLAAAGYPVRDNQFIDGGPTIGYLSIVDGTVTDIQYNSTGFC